MKISVKLDPSKFLIGVITFITVKSRTIFRKNFYPQNEDDSQNTFRVLSVRKVLDKHRDKLLAIINQS